jgi:hypothetical protein
MSGSGGGSGYSPSEKIDCTNLTIITSLASPVPAVIAGLVAGDILDIQLIAPAGPVRAVTKGGQVAGAITPFDLASLVQCITDGHSYEGQVLSITGGNCRIKIEHV